MKSNYYKNKNVLSNIIQNEQLTKNQQNNFEKIKIINTNTIQVAEPISVFMDENAPIKAIEFSFFKNGIKQTKPSKTVSFEDFLETIKNPPESTRTILRELRMANIPQERKNELKAKLPYTTISGTFSQRNDKGLIHYSGLIQIDFDALNEAKDDFKKSLLADEYILALFDSPSGTGLKGIAKISDKPEHHRACFLQMQKYFLDNYGLQVDESCKDIPRAFFLSYDSDLYVNYASQAFEPLQSPPNNEKQEIEQVHQELKISNREAKNALNGNKFESAFGFCENILRNKGSYFVEGNKSNYRFNLANLLNKCSVSENEALSYILTHYKSQTPNKDFQDVKSAYSAKYANRRGQINFIPYSKFIEQLPKQDTKPPSQAEPAKEAPTTEQPSVIEQQKEVAFPIDAFPQKIKEILCEVSENQRIPIEFLGASVLGVASSIIGNSHILKVKNNDWITAMTWICLVGASSSGKTRALKFCSKPIIKIQVELKNQFEKDLADWQNKQMQAKADKNLLFDDPEPVFKSTFVKDFTFEGLVRALDINKKGVLAYKDELASWYKSMNQYRKGADEENWLSLWSGESIKKDLVKGISLFVENPFCSVLGGTQPSKLKEFCSEGKDESGFLFRVLFAVAPKRMEVNTWNENDLPESILFDYEKICFDLFEKAQRLHPHFLRLSESAYTVWVKWFNHNEVLKFSARNEKIDSLFGKLAEYVPRIALILHLLDDVCTDSSYEEIQPHILQGAIDLVEYFRSTALEVQKVDTEQSPIKTNEENFLSDLNEIFTTKEAVEKANENSIKEKNLKMRLIPKLIKLGFIRKIRHGEYEKLC